MMDDMLVKNMAGFVFLVILVGGLVFVAACVWRNRSEEIRRRKWCEEFDLETLRQTHDVTKHIALRNEAMSEAEALRAELAALRGGAVK